MKRFGRRVLNEMIAPPERPRGTCPGGAAARSRPARGYPARVAQRSREGDAGPCPLCGRDVARRSVHHLIPRSRGGREGPTVLLCPDCHDAIHEMFSNRELAERFGSLEALRADARFARHVRWLARQRPDRRFPTRKTRERRRR